MQLNRKNAVVVRDALSQWKSQGLLDEKTAGSLLDDIHVIRFDWKRLAKYSLWVSLICIVTAIGAILTDNILMEMLKMIFDAPYLAKCVILSLISAGFYGWGVKRRGRLPEKVFTNEGILFFGVLSTASAVYEFGRAFDNGSGHFSVLLLMSCMIYGFLGLKFKSNLIWIFALASLGSWFGAETGYVSGWGAYYLGMNYPLRFVLFGGVLVGATFALERASWFKELLKSTMAMGLLYLFIALWILSIFGNYGDMISWHAIKQIELFHWSLIFGLAACASIYHGLKLDHGMTKGFGITFLFINLYTRYFEYFWNGLHKAIFFAILGATFWAISSKAEKVWNLGKEVLISKA